MDKIQGYLNKAADLLEKRGHCKGMLEDNDGRLCIRGAIITAINGIPYIFGPYVDEAEALVNAKLGCDLVDWNNAPERTKEEVVTILREAAK